MKNNDNPLVSFLLPFMNAGRWIDASLNSLARQQLHDFEIIAIDDGSTDDGPQRVERAARQGLNVRMLHHESNCGIVASLNDGIAMARGRYVARMDADDICMPQRLERQICFLEETGCDLCGSWFQVFGQGMPPRRVRWQHAEAALPAAMLFQNTICHPTVLARREVFERFAYREDYRLAEDYDLWIRAGEFFRLANVPEVLLRYRRHGEQETQARRDTMERVTRRIRERALEIAGFSPTSEERRLHHLARAPHSIRTLQDLHGVETWLLKIMQAYEHSEARSAVASQWIRACVRAAPLGRRMWDAFMKSPLRAASGADRMTEIDLKLLSMAKLDYGGRSFATLHRLGLSA